MTWLLLFFCIGIIVGITGHRLFKGWISKNNFRKHFHDIPRVRSSRPSTKRWVLRKKKNWLQPLLKYIIMGAAFILFLFIVTYTINKYQSLQKQKGPLTKKSASIPLEAIKQPPVVRKEVTVREAPRPPDPPRPPEPPPQSDPKIEKVSSSRTPISYPYAIKLGSFQNLETTRKAMLIYKKQGLAPYWVKVDLKEKGVWYRVFNGNFQESAEAEKYRKEHGLTDSSVQKILYANLIGVYSSEDEMNAKFLSLQKLGYCPYVLKSDEGRLQLFVGAYLSEEGVMQQDQALKSHGVESRVVKR